MEDNPTRELIEVYGMKPEEIAFRVGASVQSIWNWKAGRCCPMLYFERKLFVLLRRKQAN